MAKVCLDAGHGGYDPGAVGPSGLKEKDVTLDVVLRVGKYLQQAGIEVVYTRTSDQVLWSASKDLQARCDIANQSGADLFISVHCNSFSNPQAAGTETYSLSTTGNGRKVAEFIQAELISALNLTNRGLKTANYYVLKRTSMPAALTEVAFISNPREEALLRDPAFRDRAALAITKGIAKYFGIDMLPAPVPQPGPAPNAVKIRVGNLVLDGLIIGNISYAPVRALAEALGRQVVWNEAEKAVDVR